MRRSKAGSSLRGLSSTLNHLHSSFCPSSSKQSSTFYRNGKGLGESYEKFINVKQKQRAERIFTVKFARGCSVSVCLGFFLLREVCLGAVGHCWINLPVLFPSLSPVLSLRTCHTVTDHTVKHHTVCAKYPACFGMLYEIRQDVASCREHVMSAYLASCSCLSRGRECTSERTQLFAASFHSPWLFQRDGTPRHP